MKNKQAFTLIELLVVVLIIGILAAVALPQYQKAVEKSRAAQAITMLKTVYDAAKAYQLANGTWPTSFDELAVDIPWTGTTNGLKTGGWFHPGKSNADWSIQLTGKYTGGIMITRLAGPNIGAAFAVYPTPTLGNLPANQLLCVEIRNPTDVYNPFNKSTGDYCQKIMKGVAVGTAADGSWDFFRMP